MDSSKNEIDFHLVAINTLVNAEQALQIPVSFQITLLVQGSVVTGELISKNLYFTSINREIADLKLIEFMDKIQIETDKLLSEHDFEMQCLHLKNVTIQQANNSEAIKLSLMRILLTAVGGSSLLPFQHKA